MGGRQTKRFPMRNLNAHKNQKLYNLITFGKQLKEILFKMTETSKFLNILKSAVQCTPYCVYERGTRQIIRYRATATLRRPQIKQYTASKEGEGYKTNGNII